MFNTQRKENIVFDGNYYLYRAYYASFKAKLCDKRGRPTGALKFFHNMLKPHLHNRVIVVFDHPGKNFRYDLFKDYKKGRTKMPDDLIAQREPIEQLVSAYGIPILKIKGVEADDVIGTLSRIHTDQQKQLKILTGDKDCGQFVSQYVSLYDSKAEKTTTLKTLREGGLEPRQIVYLLSLMGDSVDNIPGVKGIGSKIAMDLIRQFGTLKELARNTDRIKSKSVRQKIENSMDDLRISFKLAKCKLDVELPRIEFGHADYKAVNRILKEYDIRS
jgi:DNA polymerase-1